MSATPGKWSFVLARSVDMQQVGILRNASSKQLSLAFNRPGSFSFRMPIDDPLSFEIDNRSTCVIAFRNNFPVWSGPVVAVSDAVPDDFVSVSCVGWMEEMDHRYIRPSEEPGLIFAGIPGGEIIMSLIDTCNAQVDGQVPPVVRPTHVVSGSWTDTQVRSRSYKRAENYGEKIRELSDVENGCDIYIDPISRVVTVRAPDDFYDRPECHFGYGVFPHNMETVSRSVDGSRISNRVTIVGASNTAGFAESSEAIDDAGILLEEWITLSDVSDITVLAEYANGEMTYKKNGVITYSIKPMSLGTVPRLFDDFSLGDRVYFSVDRGRFQVSREGVRVFSVNIDISDDTGDEIFSEIGTSPST